MEPPLLPPSISSLSSGSPDHGQGCKGSPPYLDSKKPGLPRPNSNVPTYDIEQGGNIPTTPARSNGSRRVKIKAHSLDMQADSYEFGRNPNDTVNQHPPKASSKTRKGHERSLSREMLNESLFQDALNRAHYESKRGPVRKHRSNRHVRRNTDPDNLFNNSKAIGNEKKREKVKNGYGSFDNGPPNFSGESAHRVHRHRSSSGSFHFESREMDASNHSRSSWAPPPLYVQSERGQMDGSNHSRTRVASYAHSERSSSEASISHPGLGTEEFDPRKEFAYYASHYKPSPSTSRQSSPVVHGMPPPIPSTHYRSHSSSVDWMNGSNHSTMSAMTLDPEQMALLEASNKGKHHRRHSSRSSRMARMVEQQVAIENSKGEDQPTACRDLLFAILFVVQLGAVAYAAVKLGPQTMMKYHLIKDSFVEDGEVWLNFHYIIRLAGICGIFASLLSVLALSMMMQFPENVIRYSLGISISLAFAWGTLGIGLSPKSLVPISGVLALTFFVSYSFLVWERIHFATVNLHTALDGINSNIGVVGVACGALVVVYCWCMLFAFAFVGIFDLVQYNKNHPDLYDHHESEAFILLRKYHFVGLILSFAWTYQVLKNIVVTTVVGSYKRWWFEPTSSANAVRASFTQSMTRSFGSICYGSLFVRPVSILKHILSPFRPQKQPSSLLCLQEFLFCCQEFLVSSVDKLYSYFNPWTMVYVGMYGYSFLKAGKKSALIFEARSWSTIVNDDLYFYVLLIVTIVISGSTGIFGVVVEHYTTIGDEAIGISSFHKPGVTSFLIGAIMGLLLSSIVMAVVMAALDALFVCWASGPVDFQKNHAELNTRLRKAWKEAWPDSMV